MTVRGRLVGSVLGRRSLQWLFERSFEWSLLGMNFDASDLRTNGERRVVEHLASANDRPPGPWTVLDVGANVGEWSKMTSEVLSNAGIEHVIWAFEPGTATFGWLTEGVAAYPAVRPQRIALGAEEGTGVLHYDKPGSGLASLHSRRSVTLGLDEDVEITTVDAFRKQNGIGRVHLLKLDVEGHELGVLWGARAALEQGAVDVLQFEFGGTQIDSRTFMRDLYDVLGDGYQIHRVLRDGLRPLGRWNERLEIFRLGNYVALHREVSNSQSRAGRAYMVGGG